MNVQQISATGLSFAAILADGSVVTWGNPAFGGDSSTVQDQLRNVQQIRGTDAAFTAILADGQVVSWGYREDCYRRPGHYSYSLEREFNYL
jgi:alpha-tubulin suppressor-like RCC1 family protein